MIFIHSLESVVTDLKACWRYICGAQVMSELWKIWSSFWFARKSYKNALSEKLQSGSIRPV